MGDENEATLKPADALFGKSFGEATEFTSVQFCSSYILDEKMSGSNWIQLVCHITALAKVNIPKKEDLGF